jgi:RND family efflux transporter MFP subunit
MKIVSCLLTSLGLVFLASCGRREAPGQSEAVSLAPIRAQVVTVHVETLPVIEEVTGTVQPVQRAQLAAKVMGAIEEMPVTLGQRVHRGDRLVSISAGEINARVAQAQSQFNEARRDLERERGLLPAGASTTDTVKGLEDRFAAAQAMLREAEVMLGYATIRAPFDGVITRKFANAGDLASPGLPLLDIEGFTGFEVEAGVPDSLAAGLAIGTPVAVEIPALGASFAGTLSELSSAADPNSHTVAAKVAVPGNAAVHSGQFARIQVPGAPVRFLLAPESAVGALGQMERIFVAGDDNRAVLRLVKTGARRGGRVEILAGLDDGERVLLAPPTGLREGQPLEIQP